MALIHGLHFNNLRGDLLGGLTAAVVALPLALAFGNAALGPGGAIYGLYGAVAAGFIAALLGGTPAQVSGPTGPMSVTVAGVVSSLAAVGVSRELAAGEMLPLVMAAVVIGGLLEALLGSVATGPLHHPCALFRCLRLHVGDRCDHSDPADRALCGHRNQRWSDWQHQSMLLTSCRARTWPLSAWVA